MIEIKGVFTSAKFIVDDVEYASIQQIQHLCNLDVLENSKIRVMADVCPGIGTTIGSTFTYSDSIMPVLIGSDIGCGIVTVKLSAKRIELKQLDKIVRENLVGRSKIERRPLILIEAEYEGNTIRTLLQNAETIRIVDENNEPLSVADVKPGDKVKVYVEKNARHFGIAIDETIIEQ